MARSAGDCLVEWRSGREDGSRGLVLKARVARGTVVLATATGRAICAARRAEILLAAIMCRPEAVYDANGKNYKNTKCSGC
jgi:hypothetical protein